MRVECKACGESKAAGEFHWRDREAGKLQSKCKACVAEYSRRHYRENRGPYIERAKARNVRMRAVFREEVDRLKSRPCADCGGVFHPCMMDFDHREPALKSFTIGMLDRIGSVRRLEEEAAKCDVVCANCHRLREHMRRSGVEN